MNHKKTLSLVLALCLFLTVLAGCGRKPAETAAPKTAAPEVTSAAPRETTAASEKTAAPEETTEAPEETTAAPEETTEAPEETTAAPEESTAPPGEPRHLNAASHMVGTSLDAAVRYQGWTLTRSGIGETLVKLDNRVELEACVADSWEWVDEYSLKLHIREGIFFHSGKAVDAAAVKLCFEHVAEINERFPNYIDLKEIIADGQYLTIVSNTRNPQMLWNLTEPLFCVMDVTVEDIANKPAGTGPYMVNSFVEDRIELEANRNYWNGEVGLDTITFTRVSDAEARVMALQSGELDMTVTIDHTNIKLFENEDYNVSVVSGVRTNVVKMNHARPFLKYKELRQAISYAIDRDTYGANITGGAPSVCLFPASVPFDIDSIEGYSYDVDKAMQILDEAGFVDTDDDGIREIDGQNIHLEYYQSAAHGSAEAGLIAQAIQADLKIIGVDVEIMSSENMSDIKNAGLYDFCSDNSNTVPTGDGQYFLTNMYHSSSGSNKSAYSNPEFDALIESFNDAYSAEERYAIAHEAAQMLNDDAADLFVTTVPMSTVSRAYVKNAEQHTVDYYMITRDITIER